MSDKERMTDNEIIKALECCSANYIACKECPFNSKSFCERYVIENAFDFVKRQQAEIERLKRENKILSINADNAFQDGLNEAQDLYAEQVKNEVQAEAINEFADRLGNYKEYRYNENCDFVPYVRLSDIEKVVYEMVGAESEIEQND